MTDLWHFGRAICEQWWWLRCHSTPARYSSAYPFIVEEDTWKRIVVQGALDSESIRHNAAIWSEVRGHHYVLDLAGVDFLDSAAVGLLIQIQKRLQAEGFLLVLLTPSSAVQRALRLMRQSNFFLIASNTEEARELLRTKEQEQSILTPASTTLAAPLIWQGEITARNAEDIWQPTEAYIMSHSFRQERLTIDLSRVRFLDSTAVAMMARAKRLALQLGATLQFVNPSGDVRNVVCLARLQSFLFGETL
jgi:anti-anti-sigma factor